MIPVAGVLLLIVVVFTIGVVVSNPAVFELSVFGATVPVTAAGVYASGAGAMLVLVLAAVLLRRGLQRELRRRRQVKTLRVAAAGVTRTAPADVVAEPRQSDNSTEPPPVDAKGTGRRTAGADAAAGVTAPDGPTDGGDSQSGVVAHGATAVPPGRSGQARSRPAAAQVSALPDSGAGERQALLEEAEELTGDSADR